MKKLLLLSFLVAFAHIAFGQVNLYENFNDELPAEWTTVDHGYNPGTWEYTDQYGFNGSGGVTIDTYDSGSTEDGRADDWLISPRITVADGDVLSFWANCSGSYPDEISIQVSTNTTDTTDFTEVIAKDTVLTGEYTKYEFVLTDLAGVSDGNQIYIGIHTTSNGSYINLDNFKVAQPGSFLMMTGYAINSDAIDVAFDDSLSTVNAADFELIGSETVTFGSATIDSENKTLVHFTGATASMSGDNVLDTLVNNAIVDSIMFYAGITPVSFTNNANSGGTVNESNIATYTGKVSASDGDNELIVADAAGAYNGVHLYGVDAASYSLGDTLTFYGVLSPYYGQTELYNPTIINSAASVQGPYPATIITPADIDTSITQDTNPAEQFENVLVTLEDVTIDSYDAGTGYFYATDGSDVFRIGSDAVNLYDGTFDETVLQVGSVYDITGIVVGMDGDYHVVPRHMNDLQMVEDNTAPVVSYAAQTATNATGQTVNVQSNEASGDVYIILEGEAQATIADLETAVTNQNGAKAAVTAADTDIAVSTHELTPGNYYAYATDSADNLSVKGSELIVVNDSSDVIAPVVSYAEQTATSAEGQQVILQSNEAGKIYIVKDGILNDTSVAVFDSLANEYEAAFATATADQDVNVSTAYLKPGTYYGYAVDPAGNISEPGANTITVIASGLTLPYEENFADSAAISSYGMKAVDSDEDGFNWYVATYQSEIYVESESWDSDAGPLTPNNYLISPKIDLSNVSNAELRWFDLTIDPDYPAEHYQVRISTTTDDTTAFTEENIVFETTLTADDANAWNQRTADLSDYAGQEIYIAWIHNQSYDNYKLALDSIRLYEMDVTAPEVSADAQTVTIGDDVLVQSSEDNGKVYVVLDGEPQATPSDLESAVSIGTAASAEVTAANTDMAISTSGLTAGTYYAYAVDEAGNMSDKSTNAITLEEGDGTGIFDQNDEVSISIYPNPVKDHLFFTAEEDVSKVVVFNALGQKVKEVEMRDQNRSVRTSDLKDGLYFINFENEQGVIHTSKFIKE